MSESIAGASLKRTPGPFSVLLFGLAFLAPLIVFGTYGVITQASGNTTAMAYLIAAIGVVFTALSYGRLVRVFPVAGSAYTYTRKMLSANLRLHGGLGRPARLLLHPDADLAARRQLPQHGLSRGAAMGVDHRLHRLHLAA